MSKQAFYHQHGQEPLRLRIVKQSKGLVDLAKLDSEEIVVAQCVLESEPRPGSATLIAATPKTKKGSAGSEEGGSGSGEGNEEQPDEGQEGDSGEEGGDEASE